MRETFCKVHQEGVYLQSRMIRFQFNSVKTTELSEIQDHAMESAWPRTIAASLRVSLRAGSGNRALPGDRPGRSAANVTSSSGCFAMARRHDVTARLNGSVGDSFDPVLNLMFEVVMNPD